MYKIYGALCIIGGCGYAGLKVAGIYRKRSRILRGIQNGLNFLETEICYGLTPLPLALQRVGQKLDNECSPVFSGAAEILRRNKGTTANEAWEVGLGLLSQNVPLKKEELLILTMFGRSLGNSAKEEQQQNFALTREQLHMAEQAATEARVKNERMWQYLGFCLGAVIVLILI